MEPFNLSRTTTKISSPKLQLNYTLHTCCILVASQGHESTILHTDLVNNFSKNYIVLTLFVHPVVCNPLHPGLSKVLAQTVLKKPALLIIYILNPKLTSYWEQEKQLAFRQERDTCVLDTCTSIVVVCLWDLARIMDVFI